MKSLRMIISSCVFCPFIRYGCKNVGSITVCGNDEAIERTKGYNLIIPRNGIPKWCPLLDTIEEHLEEFDDVDDISKPYNAILYSERTITVENYAKLTYGDSCPKTGKAANPFKCSSLGGTCIHLHEVATRELVTMIVVDSICCKHPDAKEE